MANRRANPKRPEATINAISPSVRVERIGNATLYCGDCREILPSLDRQAVIVSDPPYGIRHTHDGGGYGIWRHRHVGGIIGDDGPFDPSPLLYFSDAILWGANHFADKLPSSAGWLIWDKKLGLKEDNFSDGEAAWHRKGTRLRINRRLWNGLLAHEVGERRLHQMQKPVDLMQWCVEFTMGSPVVDPYMGSGTTGVACARLGRPFVGIEIEPRYFDIACLRIDEAQRQGDLLNQLPPAEDPADARMADLFADPGE